MLQLLGTPTFQVSELSFTWLAFGGAMLSNLAFAARNIFSRVSMGKPQAEGLGAAPNYWALAP